MFSRRDRRTQLSGFALAVLLAVGVPASAGPPPPTFNSNPDKGPPGTVITVSGTGCTRPSQLGNQPGTNVHVELVGPQPGTNVVAQADFTPQSSTGDWSGQLIVPAKAPPGSYLITAICDPTEVPDDQPFEYAPNPFTVTKKAQRAQAVEAVVSFTG